MASGRGTVPYVDLQSQTAPISPMVKYSLETSQPVRLYYGQVVWIDQVGAAGDGTIIYRVNEAAPSTDTATATSSLGTAAFAVDR
jgi:hypothetical protein